MSDYSENKSELVNLIRSSSNLVSQLLNAPGLVYPLCDPSEIETYPLTVLSAPNMNGTLSTRHLNTIVSAKLKDATHHLAKLLVRVNDVKSRVLVTGE